MTIQPKAFPHLKYEELKVFQDDGDAKVVLMRHSKKDQERVVKIVDASKVSGYRDGISFEAHIGMKVINHAGFAKTYKFYVTASTHYLVLEYIQGKLFKELLEEHTSKKMPVEQFRALATSYFKAMSYLIEQKIYPKGLHERNILIQSNFTIKIIDFEQYMLEGVGSLDMGHAIYNNIRYLLPLVDITDTPSFELWEALVQSHHNADGYEELAEWVAQVLEHPFMQD